MEAGHRRRSVNERIRQINEPFAVLLGTYEIACECNEVCELLIEVPADVYARARADDSLLVHRQHVRGARIVTAHDGWAVVQK